MNEIKDDTVDHVQLIEFSNYFSCLLILKFCLLHYNYNVYVEREMKCLNFDFIYDLYLHINSVCIAEKIISRIFTNCGTNQVG